MKRNLLLLATLAACASPVCLAAENPWNGTWKLNDAKSRRTGSVDTITQSSDGKYTVATSGITVSFGCDGNEYPMPGGRRMTCTKVSEDTMHLVFKAGGEELAQVNRTLSNNGNTMTMVETGRAANGTPFRNTEISKKITPGSGNAWTGAWQNVKVQTSTHSTAIVEATGDSITFTYPMSKSSLTAKLDGTPATEQGPHPEQGLTVSLTSAGPLTMEEVDTLNGTVVEHDTLTVSPDGKAMTIDVQRTGDKAKQVYVYDKQ